MSRLEEDSGAGRQRPSDSLLIAGALFWAACAVGAAVLYTQGRLPWWAVPLVILGAGFSGIWVRRRRG